MSRVDFENAQASLCRKAPNVNSVLTGTVGVLDDKVVHSSALTMEQNESRWYAAYTSANHEKRVAEQLGLRDVEHFVPLYSSVRRWKDRRVVIQLPLFPGYVFVRIALSNRLRVLQVPGVANLVSFDGKPAPLPQREVEALRTSLDASVRIQPHPYLTVGRRVRIRSGPLSGVEGFLTRKKNLSRLVISLDLISRSVAVEVDALDVEPLSGTRQPIP
jgi:transcription antitermination factor NusG